MINVKKLLMKILQRLSIVGTFKSAVMGSSGTTSIASGTYVDCCSLSLEAGTWVVTCALQYNSGGTQAAYRAMYLANSANSNYLAVQTPGVATGNTSLSGTRVVIFTETTTIKLRALQGSGATLTMPQTGAWIQAVRIK